MPNFESQVHGRGDGDFCKATKLLYVKVGFIQVFLFKILIVAQKVYIFKGYFLEKKHTKIVPTNQYAAAINSAANR